MYLPCFCFFFRSRSQQVTYQKLPHRNLPFICILEKTTSRVKANKTLGLLRRTLSPCSKEVKTRAYQALVRSTARVRLRGMEPLSYHCNSKAWESPKSSCSVCTPRLQARHITHSTYFQTGLGPSSHTKTSCTMHHVLQSSLQLCKHTGTTLHHPCTIHQQTWPSAQVRSSTSYYWCL